MNNIAINNTIQTFTASRKTISAKAESSDFGIALQSAFSYSEPKGVNAVKETTFLSFDDLLEDMYVISDAHKLEAPLAKIRGVSPNEYNSALNEISEKRLEIIRSGEGIKVRVDAGELPKLIEEIQTGLENGDSLRDVLQKHYDSYGDATQFNGKEWFYIVPETGEVKYAWEKHRVVYSSEAQMEMDRLSCYSIADDIATVLRYTYFKEETDDPTKVQALIDGISARSSQYSMERFDPRWDTTVYRTREEMALLEQQYGACDCDGSEYDDMIDSLLELLDRHFKAEQQREAENDDFGSSSLTVAAMAAKIAVSKTNDTSTLAV